MIAPRHPTAVLLVWAGFAAASSTARAAESYDNCAGFIDALPATISTQGVWCLRHDLSTAIASGDAITIATNNVTIDCNGFKLGGLAAGTATTAVGVAAQNRLNATVRHCNIRGFGQGISFNGGGGHVVEDNRFDGNTFAGAVVSGDGSALRRNQVNDTGGSSAYLGLAYGIFAVGAVDVLDNTVSGVLPTDDIDGAGTAYGIATATNPSGSISGNRVRGLAGVARGIHIGGAGRVSLDHNRVVAAGDGNVGLSCEDSHSRAFRNTVSGFGIGIEGCGYDVGDGNVVVP